MTRVGGFAYLLVLALSVGVLATTAVRIAGRLTARADLRVLAAATIGCFLAIAEALLLGLAGVGENTIALAVTTVAIGGLVRWRVAPADGASLGQQITAGAKALKPVDAVALGAIVGGGASALTYLLWRPYTPYDALMYHWTEPVNWLHNGHPGSLLKSSSQIPVQAYPKNTEVLLGWLLGLAHSWVVGTLLLFSFLALAMLGLIASLARLGIDRRRAAFGAVALLSIPVVILQIVGPSTDLPTLAWIVVTAALCLGAAQEPTLLPIAFLAGGLAVGSKATAAPPVIVMLLAVLWVHRASLRTRAGSILVGAVPGTALGGLWYLQNLIVYKAPLYPFYRFPSGPPLPITITAFGTSFFHSARSSLRIGTLHGYFIWSGGGALILAGIGLAVVALPTFRGSERRWLSVAIGAALLDILIWSMGPFTGWPGLAYTSFFPLDGVRYLMPGLGFVALPLLLLTKSRTPLRYVVDVILLVVIGANVWALHDWPPPYRPPGLGLLAGIVIGAAAASLGVAVRDNIRLPRLRLQTDALPVIVIVAAVLAVPTHGYVARAAANKQAPETVPFEVPVVIGWLDQQPEWRDGHQAVAAGPIVNALLTGPAFTHRLVLVSQTTSCARVRALATTDWMVLTSPLVVTKAPYTYLTFNRSRCLAGVHPDFSSAGYLIYRPGSLTASG